MNETYKTIDYEWQSRRTGAPFADAEQTIVKLRLSLRAYNLITEEFPLSEKYLTPLDDNYWQFCAPVCGFEGVGRFVTGLCDDVYVEEPEVFKAFVREKIKRFK
jgi:hypothetical protein